MNKLILPITILSVLAGCGQVSNAVMSDNDLMEKAAAATGVPYENLVVTEREATSDGVKFTVQTNRGAAYNCVYASSMVSASKTTCKMTHAPLKHKAK